MSTETTISKTDLINEVAAATEVSIVDTKKVIDKTIEIITTKVSKGTSVNIQGFGSFVSAERSARKGRNPRTGAEIDIPAKTIPSFKAGKAFKEAVNA